MTVRVVNADVLAGLARLPDESVHMCVTSPPYFGLRDYGIPPQVWGGETGCGHEWEIERAAPQTGGTGAASAKQTTNHGTQGAVQRAVESAFCRSCGAWRGSLGLEPTVDLYVEHMVAVFREIRRVLRSDGVMFLNIGDSYAGSWGAQGRRVTESDEPSWHSGQIKNHPKRASGTGSILTAGLKPKDLIGVPWMLAFALRADGWWLRSEIVWAKRAPMPESCTDRPTSATEKVFLLAKSGDSTYWTHRDHAGSRLRPAPDYRWVDRDNGDAETDVEPENWRSDRKRWRRINLWSAHDYFYDNEAVKEEADGDTHSRGNKRAPPIENAGIGHKDWCAYMTRDDEIKSSGKRNQRNFWKIDENGQPLQTRKALRGVRTDSFQIGLFSEEGRDDRGALPAVQCDQSAPMAGEQSGDTPSNAARLSDIAGGQGGSCKVLGVAEGQGRPSKAQPDAPPAQASNRDDPHEPGVGDHKGTGRVSLSLLQTENETFNDGPCDPDQQRREPRGGEHRSGLPPMQLQQTQQYSKSALTNFWELGPEPFPEAHFATFVSEIPRRAILAGTSERGVCPKCAAPWARIVEKTFVVTRSGTKRGGGNGLDVSNRWDHQPNGVNESETIGWRPTCGCDAGDPVPATVLEPFAGAFTTCLVAEQLRRNSIGIELNPEYCEMGRRRLAADASLFFAETA